MLSTGRLSIIWLIVLAVTLLAGAGVYFQGQLADQEASSTSATSQETVSKPAPPAGMDEAQREYIWDIEHHGNVLSRGDDGFRALAAALCRSDRKKLAGMVAPDFAGQTLGKATERVHVANDFAEIVRLQNGVSSPERLN